MKYYWLLPITALLLLAGFYYYARQQGAGLPEFSSYEGRPLPSREALEKLGRPKIGQEEKEQAPK